MNTITKRIEIDLYSPTSYEVVIAQQGDNISRTIEFVLYSQGEPYLFTDEDHKVLAVIGGRRGDHSSFMKECSLKDNVITAVLDSDVLYVPGTIQAKIFLYDSNTDTILSTIPFLISVQEDPCDKNRMEAEKSSAFDWLILQFQKLKSSFGSHITDFSNPHQVTKDQVGLGNVPNVTTNDQTPTYETPDDLSELSSGETLSSAFGKLSKTVSEFIVQKDKLDGIESGAEVNVQPDWNITDSESDAYIKNKPSIYTAAEIDNKFSSLETNIDWKESVGTYNDIAAAYPDPQDRWTVNVQDTDYTYRYNGTDWIAISANAIPKATSSVDGLFSKEDYVKFESLYSGGVAGVKGNAESRYRTGNVNLTAENVGALPNTMGATINSAYNQANAAYDRANIIYDVINHKDLYLGCNATVYGSYITAVGGYSYASGNYSTALGYSANASSYGGTAVGYEAQTNNSYATAIGYCAKTAMNESTALGSNTRASGSYCTALGSNATASGGGSIALGINVNASGAESIAIGYSSQANGAYSTALGATTNASGYGSTALGIDAAATGYDSTALGIYAGANGNYSTALGASAKANGNYSTAIGYGSTVASVNSNTIQLGTSTTSKICGYVSFSTRSDERDKADITNIEDSAIDFLNKIHAIRYCRNQREYYIDEENLSDEEKEKKLKYGLCEYDKEAHAKGTKKGSRVRVGVRAQEVLKALEETYGNSSYGNLVDDNFFDLNLEDIPEGVENQLTVNYTGFIPFLIKAVQELSKQTNENTAAIHALTSQNLPEETHQNGEADLQSQTEIIQSETEAEEPKPEIEIPKPEEETKNE